MNTSHQTPITKFSATYHGIDGYPFDDTGA